VDKNKETKRKTTGRVGEEIATKFLVSKGFKIIDRNYRKPWGEIDIIAEKESVVHFVEVKTVSSESDTSVSRESAYRPEEQAHQWKLKKVARTAELYMESKRNLKEKDFQVDVIGVLLDINTRRARCRFFEQVL
jgi:putative endonuclease